MFVTPAGIAIAGRLEQPENTSLPRLVRFVDSVMLVRPEQPRNTAFPRLVMLSGITMLVRLVESEKASY